ncbi:MAG: hypothetical protein WDA07_08775 [Leucobacter sp.]
MSEDFPAPLRLSVSVDRSVFSAIKMLRPGLNVIDLNRSLLD